MIRFLFLLFITCFYFSCANNTQTTDIDSDNYIYCKPVSLIEDDKKILRQSLNELHKRYDPQENMLTKTLQGWNYHTDAESGLFHEVRGSFSYAVALLDIGDEEYTRRAFEIIEKTISLQDTDSSSRTYGVWPYYMEEPLATKRAPADFNWADFNAVSLLDVFTGHEARIPKDLKLEIKKSIIRAARSIQKRDVGPGYTNIALMGTYVTFVTAHLFDIPDMKEYAKNRLQKFYNYTLERGGFSEYNSPTYTIVALDEMARMKKHIIDPYSKPMIDSLYAIGWNMIARHYHKPSGQWAGPHSRSYSSLVRPAFYGILKQASDGRIDMGYVEQSRDVKIKHKIPEYLLSFFLSPRYPRIETDVFAPGDPRITGTTYLTDTYAIGSANRSSLWNQRRPLLAYWGSVEKPHYLQIRFLHDLYDFSSASIYTQQKENNLLSAINFITNGGDKHISIDKLKDGKFKASDLRLRFEIGNYTNLENLHIPKRNDEPFGFVIDNVRVNLQLYHAVFGNFKGYWEKSGDDKVSWIDYVVYSGQEQEIDLSSIHSAVLGFTFSIETSNENASKETPAVAIKDNFLDATWKGLSLKTPVKPSVQPKNL